MWLRWSKWMYQRKIPFVLWTLTLGPCSLEWMRRRTKERTNQKPTMTLKWDISIPLNWPVYDFGVCLLQCFFFFRFLHTILYICCFLYSWHVRIIPLRVSFSLNAERHKWIAHFKPNTNTKNELMRSEMKQISSLNYVPAVRNQTKLKICMRQADCWRWLQVIWLLFFPSVRFHSALTKYWNDKNRNKICSYKKGKKVEYLLASKSTVNNIRMLLMLESVGPK